MPHETTTKIKLAGLELSVLRETLMEEPEKPSRAEPGTGAQRYSKSRVEFSIIPPDDED